ncbi:MAG: CHRD domain-containing protein [Acidobacteriota bacterium]|nr:CHRD domain-containing protein [Acidobacteriota bacterium]
MKRIGVAVCALIFIASSTIAFADGFRRITEFLTGFEEVPALSTPGNGEFKARISNDEKQIQYELFYRDLESAVQQAHIHLGNVSVNGGISVFLCSNLGNGPAGTQACPPGPATLTGTITAADVSPNIPATLAARNQGLDTGQMAELIRAIRAGATYVNVHTTGRPGGEIRSQIEGGSNNDDDDGQLHNH